MNLTLQSTLLKAAFVIALTSLPVAIPTDALAGDKHLLFLRSARPDNVNSQPEMRQGYLKVYSATDEFNDGDAWYFPHSSYAIYNSGGKLFRNVENHISRSDEIPEVVILPVGSYTVDVRSERDGYVRVPVVVREGRQTILRLDT
jgi:hypothetical protein